MMTEHASKATVTQKIKNASIDDIKSRRTELKVAAENMYLRISITIIFVM